ncbi:MAG TPA: hypothetical protein ENH82_08590 [bacterium]|nr:hypothetical protein [bacterium]
MIDLVLTSPGEGPATLFTRNFRVHSGIPIGLYEDGPRAPVVLVYGDITEETLRYYSERYSAIIGIPSIAYDEIPENPQHYETMTVKAPILAKMQNLHHGGYHRFVKTFEDSALVMEGFTGKTLTLLFAADLIKSTIRILSGELEKNSGLDRFGRHNPAPESVINAPAVSFHFNLIENVIRYVYKKIGLPLLYIPRWPKSATHALFLSHDIDVVRKWTIKRSLSELAVSAGDLIRFKGQRFVETVFSICNALRGKDPYWMFDELFFMESGNGFKSTWFFAPFVKEYQKRENDIDPVYRRKASEITTMIRRIIENDCEFALHGTRKAFFDTEALKAQLNSYESRIGIKIQGVRHHYLMFRHGETLEAVSEAGLSYDATLGFSDRPGFRNGIASPFFPFPVSHPAGKIIEIPLNFMDGVFLHAEDGSEGAIRRITEAYLFAKAAGGLFSVLMHPGNMDKSEIPELAQFYRSFLPRCRLDRVHSMTGIELTKWWISRENVLKSLEFGKDMWRIKGVEIPTEMDFVILAHDIRNRKFSIEGVKGTSELNHDKLIIRPELVDPEKGITFIKKK